MATMTLTTAYKPSIVRQAVLSCIRAGQPVFVMGEPGIGKSDLIRQVGEELALLTLDVRACLFDPTDVKGLPSVNGDGRVHWAIPEWLPRDGNGLLFYDELNRAPTLVQNAFFQLILDRQVGEAVLPAGWNQVSAGNNETDGGGVTRMPSALANRFIHVHMKPDVEEWCLWAAANGIAPVVRAFSKFRPNLLHAFDKNAYAFPTPRSWSFVSKVIQQANTPEVEFVLVEGAVGKGAAVEYEAFSRLFNSMPDLDAIIADPTGSAVPTNVAVLYAVAVGLSSRANGKNIAAIITYFDRMPAEYAVFAIKEMIARDPGLQSTRAYTNWAIAHQGAF